MATFGGREVDRAIVIDLERLDGQALFGFVRRLGLTDSEAGDAVQEAFLRLWAQLHAGITIENPRAWVYRAIYRLAMDEHRHQRRIRGVSERVGDLIRRRRGVDDDDRIAVWTEVDRLPERQRTALYLRYRADLEFAEIAQTLGITASAARGQVFQGMTALRRRLDQRDWSR